MQARRPPDWPAGTASARQTPVPTPPPRPSRQGNPITGLPVSTAAINPQTAPMIIMPSTPRFRTPAFSTTNSPIAASMMGTDATISEAIRTTGSIPAEHYAPPAADESMRPHATSHPASVIDDQHPPRARPEPAVLSDVARCPIRIASCQRRPKKVSPLNTPSPPSNASSTISTTSAMTMMPPIGVRYVNAKPAAAKGSTHATSAAAISRFQHHATTLPTLTRKCVSTSTASRKNSSIP